MKVDIFNSRKFALFVFILEVWQFDGKFCHKSFMGVILRNFHSVHSTMWKLQKVRLLSHNVEIAAI